jgi:hypothetical protein
MGWAVEEVCAVDELLDDRTNETTEARSHGGRRREKRMEDRG